MNHAVLYLEHVIRIGVQSFRLQKSIEVIQVRAIEQNDCGLVRWDLLRSRAHCSEASQQSKPSHPSPQPRSTTHHESLQAKSQARTLLAVLIENFRPSPAAVILTRSSSHRDPNERPSRAPYSGC